MMKLAKIPPKAKIALVSAVDDHHPVSNLEQLGVSQRLINLLQSNGINEMSELMNKRAEYLMGLQNFGEKQLGVLFEALSKYDSVDNGI